MKLRRDEKNARNAGLYLAQYVAAREDDWGYFMRDTRPNQGYGSSKAAVDAHDSAQWLHQHVAPNFRTFSMPGAFASPAAFAKALVTLQDTLVYRHALLTSHVAASPGMTPITVRGVLDEIEACLDAVVHAQSKLGVAPAPVPTTPFDKALSIANRFPSIVASLSRRRQPRAALTMSDEYDVQYLFEALLALEFDDIRTEETASSFAGGSIRLDTLLGDEGVAIEYKMTRPGLDNVPLRKQLSDDIMAHKENQKISQLLVFVYDPSKFVRNPRGFEKAFSKPVETLTTVRTIVQQG